MHRLYKRLIGYLKPYMPLYAICSLVNGIALFLLFSSVGILLREVVKNSAAIADREKLIQTFLYLLGIICFTALSGFAVFGFRYIEQKIQTKLRRDMVNTYLHGEEAAVHKFSSTEVLNRINSDLPRCVELVGYYMDGRIFAPVLSGIFSLVFLLETNGLLALATLICSAFNAFAVQIASKKEKEKNAEVLVQKSRLLEFMQECAAGKTEVRTFSLQEHFQKKQEEKLKKLAEKKRRIGKYRGARKALLVMAVDCFTVVSLLLLGNVLARKKWIVFSEVMLALPLADQISQMITAFGDFRTVLRTHQGYMERVFEILDLKQEKTGERKADETQMKQTLRLEGVSFCYEKKTVLDDISIEIPFGKKAAFVGPSGCGKSSVLKLILNLYEPQEGELFLGEIPIRDMVKNQWRNYISYYPQELSFFHTNVAENVGMEGEPDKVRVGEVMKVLDEENFFQKAANGYEMILETAGEEFSGGQLQKIALARCLYRKAPFLLLDEPISAMDEENGKLVEKVLWKYGKDCTVIVITHRLKLIENFDIIFVMDKGKIVEQGKHGELLKLNGRYAGMWKQQ